MLPCRMAQPHDDLIGHHRRRRPRQPAQGMDDADQGAQSRPALGARVGMPLPATTLTGSQLAVDIRRQPHASPPVLRPSPDPRHGRSTPAVPVSFQRPVFAIRDGRARRAHGRRRMERDDRRHPDARARARTRAGRRAVHGIPTSPALWRHVLPLVDDAHLLAWEMVGYGRSSRTHTSADISVKAQAGRLHRWLDELGIERAVLVGHDLGGGVCQVAAVNPPERCAGLVLTNSIAYDSWPIPMVRALQRVRGGTARLTPRLFKPLLADFLHPGHDSRARARESLEAHRPGYAHLRGPAAFARQVAIVANGRHPGGRQSPAAARRPGGGCLGRRRPVPEGRVRAPPRCGPSCPDDGDPGGKHFVPEDHPREVADAVSSGVATARGLSPLPPPLR